MSRFAAGLLLWGAIAFLALASRCQYAAERIARRAGLKTAFGLRTGIDPYDGRS